MKYNELELNAHKRLTRVGRGISAGGGKTAGRGTKGQNARAGHKKRPEIRDFIKKDGVSICKNRESFFNYLSKEELKKFNSSSLFSIIQFAANNRIALILEVNRGDFIYTKFAIDVIKGLMSNLNK
mgnify:CR=1 FL=1